MAGINRTNNNIENDFQGSQHQTALLHLKNASNTNYDNINLRVTGGSSPSHQSVAAGVYDDICNIYKTGGVCPEDWEIKDSNDQTIDWSNGMSYLAYTGNGEDVVQDTTHRMLTDDLKADYNTLVPKKLHFTFDETTGAITNFSQEYTTGVTLKETQLFGEIYKTGSALGETGVYRNINPYTDLINDGSSVRTTEGQFVMENNYILLLNQPVENTEVTTSSGTSIVCRVYLSLRPEEEKHIETDYMPVVCFSGEDIRNSSTTTRTVETKYSATNPSGKRAYIEFTSEKPITTIPVIQLIKVNIPDNVQVQKPTQTSVTATYTGAYITNGYTRTGGVDFNGDESGLNVGTYTCIYTPRTGYEWTDGTTTPVTVTLTITQKSIVGASIVLGPTNTYTGSTVTQTISSATIDGILITSYNITGNTGINAGSYTLTCTGTGNFNGSQTASWSIDKATSSVTTAPTNRGVTYTGSAQAIANAGACSGGTLYYKAANTTQTSYGTGIPTSTNVGSYTLYYYVSGDSNHYDSAEYSIICSIATAAMTATPTAASKTYDGGSTYAQIKVNVAGTTVEYGTSTSYGYSLTATSANTNYGMSSVTRTEYGTTTVYYRVSKANYTTVTGSTTIGISKRSLTIPSLSNTGYTYDGNSHSCTVNNFNSSYENQSGTTSSADVGYKTVTWSLKNTTSTQWSDGTTGSKSASWYIQVTSSCLAFTANAAGSTLKLSNTYSYSYDRINWASASSSTTITLSSAGTKVYLRAAITSSLVGQFTMTGSIAASGNIMALCDNGLCTMTTIPRDSIFIELFMGCTSLTAPPTLPATTLASDCYDCMFVDCSSLTTAPTLPATTLAEDCYYSMFESCSSLTTAPALPATTLAPGCYNTMFADCSSLTTAPTLPATTLAGYCYDYMFAGCTSLTAAPALPATSLASNCYSYMFAGCSSLRTAPALPATTLASNCYECMFAGCSSLTTAPALPATTLAEDCYHEMFTHCTSLIVSEISGSGYSNAWRIPKSGTFINTYAQSAMFYGCPKGSGRSSDNMPGAAGNAYTYYTQNTPV